MFPSLAAHWSPAGTLGMLTTALFGVNLGHGFTWAQWTVFPILIGCFLPAPGPWLGPVAGSRGWVPCLGPWKF